MLLEVELSPGGIDMARGTLDEVDALLGGRRGSAEAASGSAVTPMGRGPDIVIVYEHATTNPDSLTPRLLELFAREEPLTPEEIGIELGNGQPLTKAQARAVMRNLSRMQKHLVGGGQIAGPVLERHFGSYEQEHAGRYGLSDEDRAALRAHLGI